MKNRLKIAMAALVAGAAVAPLAAPAQAAEATAARSAPCFFVSQWEGWSAPDDNTLLLRVRHKDVYKIQVTGGARFLRSPGAFLVSENRTSGSVCSHLDLDLVAADSSGWRQPLITRSITKLSPEEIAALPKKDLP